MHGIGITEGPEDAPVSLNDHHAIFLESFNTGAMCFFDGLYFVVPSGIYKPAPGSSTEVIWESLKEYIDSDISMRYNCSVPHKFLEIGAGSGAISILIKKYYPWIDVVSTDISERACTTIECNALLNNVSLKIIRGDMWEPVKTEHNAEQYDGIIFNVPLMDKEIENEHEFSLCDPNGDLLHRFLNGLTDHVKPDGFALFLHASFSAPIPDVPGHMQIMMETQRPENNFLQSILWKNV